LDRSGQRRQVFLIGFGDHGHDQALFQSDGDAQIHVSVIVNPLILDGRVQ
jgi:hypothetical protein